jgi:hypothetical protein
MQAATPVAGSRDAAAVLDPFILGRIVLQWELPKGT